MTYIMEDPREAERLAAKVDSKAWVTKYIAHLLKPGVKVLEVGCGPGHLLSAASDACGGAIFKGIDLSSNRLQGAIVPLNVTLLQGDIQALPFEDGQFDLVYCRFLLEYLQDPAQAIKELARVTHSGGNILLQDLDGQLVSNWPPVEPLMTDVNKVVTLMKKTGFDPFVGRKLFSFALQAKLEIIDVKVESYHLYAGRISATEESQWDTKLEIALPHMSKALGSRKSGLQLKKMFLEYLRQVDTLTYSMLFSVYAKKV